jgi:hypothetical protein
VIWSYLLVAGVAVIVLNVVLVLALLIADGVSLLRQARTASPLERVDR